MLERRNFYSLQAIFFALEIFYRKDEFELTNKKKAGENVNIMKYNILHILHLSILP